MILELLADAGLGLGGLDLDRRLRPPGQGPLGPIVVGVLLANQAGGALQRELIFLTTKPIRS